MSEVPKYRWKTIEISKLKPHPQNVKIHPISQIEALMAHIKVAGFTDPVAIDEENVIWAGNASYFAAKALGLRRVPYVSLAGKSMEEKLAYMVRDNQVNESKWNLENLRLAVSENPKINYEEQHINITSLLPEIKLDNAVIPIDVPEVPIPKKAPKVCTTGDVFELGRHKIICGDCTNADLVNKLLADRKVDQLLTDPPYGVDYGEKNKFLNSIAFANRIETPIENDAIDNYRKFFGDFLKIIPFSEYNTIYVFLRGKHSLDLELACQDCGITWTTWLVWEKNNHVLGRMDYATIHEPILYGWKGQHKFHGPFRTSILKYNKPQSSPLHPTTKPIDILVQLLSDGSQTGAIIYDPFLGSGSTLLACEMTNRTCFGMEIDPAYCDILIKRWEDFAQQKAVKL